MSFFDHAASTPIRAEVLSTLHQLQNESFANPSSIHSLGRESKQKLDNFRACTAETIKVDSQEIIFTSSGTTSCNLAIKGIGLGLLPEKKQIIISAIEHSAVLESANYLKKLGFQLLIAPVDRYGVINLEKFKKLISKKTGLVSIMHTNNEIGTIQPVQEIYKICKHYGAVYHIDACQSALCFDLSQITSCADAISLNSAKIYGPKGVGVCWLRGGTRCVSLIHGGSQENGYFAGTENISLIGGFVKALELAQSEVVAYTDKMRKLGNFLHDGVVKIPETVLNGSYKDRCPSILNFKFKNIDSESLVIRLDRFGIFVATGAACTESSNKASHVYEAIGIEKQDLFSNIRFSLGASNTKKEIEYTLKILNRVVKDLREISFNI